MLTDRALAEFASAIYTEKADVSLALEADAFYRQEDDELVVACPGTHVADARAWLRDFSAAPSRFSSLGTVHGGFGLAAHDLWYGSDASKQQWVSKEVVDAKYPRGMTTYMGHSLGGAVASLLAAYHGATLATPFRLITWGAPRAIWFWNASVGPALAKAKEIRMYQRAGDPVPGVPYLPAYRNWPGVLSVGRPVSPAGPLGENNHAIDLYAEDMP